MSETLDAIPQVQVKGSLVAYLNVDGAREAGRLYQQAFGAEVAAEYPPDEKGRTMHLHLYIGDSSLMLSDFYPEHGHQVVQPEAFSLMLPIDRDIEARFQRAVDAGMEVVMPVQKMFWGDLYGQLKDRFGVLWAMNQPG